MSLRTATHYFNVSDLKSAFAVQKRIKTTSIIVKGTCPHAIMLRVSLVCFTKYFQASHNAKLATVRTCSTIWQVMQITRPASLYGLKAELY